MVFGIIERQKNYCLLGSKLLERAHGSLGMRRDDNSLCALRLDAIITRDRPRLEAHHLGISTLKLMESIFTCPVRQLGDEERRCSDL